MLILRTFLMALNFLRGVSLSALLLCYAPKIDDVFNLSDTPVLFFFISTKQGIKRSLKASQVCAQKQKNEFVGSLRWEMCGGRFGKVVDGCTTGQPCGENHTHSLLTSKDYRAYWGLSISIPRMGSCQRVFSWALHRCGHRGGTCVLSGCQLMKWQSGVITHQPALDHTESLQPINTS